MEVRKARDSAVVREDYVGKNVNVCCFAGSLFSKLLKSAKCCARRKQKEFSICRQLEGVGEGTGTGC